MTKVYNIDGEACYNSTCTFTLVNGSILTSFGIIGTLFSTFTIYCLLFHIRLPRCQNMFILNVAVGDLIIAMMGIVRGLGIIDPYFVGYNESEGQPNWWCYTYTLMGNTLWMTTIPVLIPLTIDRFVALVFPMKYTQVIKTRTSRLMIIATWALLSVIFIYDMVCLGLKGKELVAYQPAYHRCVITTSRTWKKAVFTMVPFFAIVIMYITMLLFVSRTRVESKKLMVVSMLIIATGLMTITPDLLLTAFHVKMNYKVAQVTTVTFWFTNPIWNSLIYFCNNRNTQKNLAATSVGRKISAASINMSNRAKRIGSIMSMKSEDCNKELESLPLETIKIKQVVQEKENRLNLNSVNDGEMVVIDNRTSDMN